ncbi:MAG: BlaI/MecI/CopY family transcriptional regulator [Bryobacteraceae bacterium]
MLKNQQDLSRRERQIMDILYQRGRATAADVLEALPDPPSYSAVRSLLRILEEKGHIRHEEDGLKYVFSPVVAQESAKRSALRHLIDTFFSGSPAEAAAALLDDSAAKLTKADLDRLTQMINRTRKDGKK